MKVLIFLLLICLSLEYIKLNQYSSTTIYGSDDFYLSLSGFKSGDKVYIEVSYNSYISYSHTIKYKQSNSHFNSDFNDLYSFTYMISGSTSTSNYKKTTYYTIKLTGNYDYLLFKFSGGNTWFTIKHTRSSPTWIIIVCVSALVAIVATAVIFYWCRRRSVPDYATRIDDPLVSTYPVVQPQPQPPVYVQPAYQPYVVQPGYP